MPSRLKRNKQSLVSFSKRAYLSSRAALGRFVSHTRAIRKACKIFAVHIGSASYWKQKYEDHTFHSDSHGGLRFTKFTEGEFQAINEILWNQCQRKPTTRLGE
jgi:hypothetical protein